ncbi:MAG: glycosyltransferase family 4 protein [Saprospiraceae bacterium]|nr:glycosyltransferase family 4 protein [Lewinella sp.]
MRILILVKSFSPPTETFIYHDAVALQQSETVKIVCLERLLAEDRPFELLEQIKYTKSWLHRKLDNQLYKFNISLNFSFLPFRKQLAAVLEDFQPDIIHLHFGIHALQFIDNFDFAGPIFITFHGYDATKLVKKSAVYRKRLYRLFQQHNIFPLATSASLFEYMAGFGLTSPRSQVMYSGVRMNLFQWSNNQRKSEVKVLTQLSSFREKKGHEYLLRAFRELLHKRSSQSLELWLAGGGPLEGAMKELARQLGIADKVKFLGWITQEEAVELLQQTDVFAHPSITTDEEDMESTTVVILEAMAMALPVFATRHSGIPEIVEHGVNGLMAEERNIDEYVDCMDALLDWGPQPQNRAKIAEDFSHEQHLQQLLAAYRSGLNG